MNTKKLISKLQENHIKFNSEVENYSENGEEDFKIWLDKEIKIYMGERRRIVIFKTNGSFLLPYHIARKISKLLDQNMIKGTSSSYSICDKE